MKATTNRRELLDLLGKLKTVVPSKATLPVCRSILVQAGEGKLTAIANNLEVALSGQCKAKVVEAGGVCVPLEILGILKSANADDVTLVSEKAMVTVKIGKTSIQLEGFEAQDFPPVPAVEGNAIVITGLAEALGIISHCMEKEGIRPVLNGVCLTAYSTNLFHSPKKAIIELAAADGYQLGITQVMATGSLPKPIILPFGTVKAIEKLFKGEVTMRVKDNSEADNSVRKDTLVSFEAENLTMVSQTTPGTFPNYPQLVPKKCAHKVSIPIVELKPALKTLAGLKPLSGVVRLQTKGKSLILSAKYGDADANASIPIRATGWVKIALNVTYLIELANRVGEELVLRTNTPSEPVVAKTAETTYVVMPMFVQWDEEDKPKVEEKVEPEPGCLT